MIASRRNHVPRHAGASATRRTHRKPSAVKQRRKIDPVRKSHNVPRCSTLRRRFVNVDALRCVPTLHIFNDSLLHQIRPLQAHWFTDGVKLFQQSRWQPDVDLLCIRLVRGEFFRHPFKCGDHDVIIANNSSNGYTLIACAVKSRIVIAELIGVAEPAPRGRHGRPAKQRSATMQSLLGKWRKFDVKIVTGIDGAGRSTNRPGRFLSAGRGGFGRCSRHWSKR